MKRRYLEPAEFYPPKGKHAEKHTKIRSEIPEIAIAKVEKAVEKRLRKWKRNMKLSQMNSHSF